MSMEQVEPDCYWMGIARSRRRCYSVVTAPAADQWAPLAAGQWRSGCCGLVNRAVWPEGTCSSAKGWPLRLDLPRTRLPLSFGLCGHGVSADRCRLRTHLLRALRVTISAARMPRGPPGHRSALGVFVAPKAAA